MQKMPSQARVAKNIKTFTRTRESQPTLFGVPRYSVHFLCIVSDTSISFPNGHPRPKHAERSVEDAVPLSPITPTGTMRLWEVLEKIVFFLWFGTFLLRTFFQYCICKFRLQIRATLANFNFADQEWGWGCNVDVFFRRKESRSDAPGTYGWAFDSYAPWLQI